MKKPVKNKHAQAMARLSAAVRRDRIPAERRSEIARIAATARCAKSRANPKPRAPA